MSWEQARARLSFLKKHPWWDEINQNEIFWKISFNPIYVNQVHAIQCYVFSPNRHFTKMAFPRSGHSPNLYSVKTTPFHLLHLFTEKTNFFIIYLYMISFSRAIQIWSQNRSISSRTRVISCQSFFLILGSLPFFSILFLNLDFSIRLRTSVKWRTGLLA